MPESDPLLQTLQRIETKVDASIVYHAERIAKLETAIAATDAKIEKQDTRQYVHSVVTFCGVMLSHLGLGKLGVKI